MNGGGGEVRGASASPAVRPATVAGSTGGTTWACCDDSFGPTEFLASFASLVAFESPEPSLGFFESVEFFESFEIFESVEIFESFEILKTFESTEPFEFFVSMDSFESSRDGGTGGLSSMLTAASMETPSPCSSSPPPPLPRLCALCVSVELATPDSPLSCCFGGARTEGSKRSGLKRTSRLQCSLR